MLQYSLRREPNLSEHPTDKLPSPDDVILAAIRNLGDQVGAIGERLDRLEQKVDARLHDTRPIWHKVVADIEALQNGQRRIEESQQATRFGLNELKSSVRDVNRDQIVMNDVLRRIQLDFHNLDERLHALSSDRKPRNS